MDAADLVGYIVGERDDGYYVYACAEHTDDGVPQELHRHVLREEAEQEGATCCDCGLELAEAEAI